MENQNQLAIAEQQSAFQQTPAANQLTPSQARVEAVAKTLADAYSRASTLALTPEESAALMLDFPDEAIRSGARGDANLLYVEHAFVRQRLLEVFGPGQWTIINRRHWLDDAAGWMYADVILVARGCFVGECIGACRYSSKNSRINYADAVKGAESDALGRIAGTALGVGLQLWKAGWCEGWKQRQRSGQRPATPAREYPIKPPEPVKATEKTRAWMLGQLSQFTPEELLRFYEHQYRDTIPGLEAWSLDHVPTNKTALAELTRAIEDWLEPNGSPEKLGAPNNLSTMVDNGFSEPFWNQVITVPRAGMKRVDYLKAPDSIRSLYDAMKAGDEKARTRLFGLAREWQPSSYIGSDGNEHPASNADIECRKRLDEFLKWSDKRH